MAGQVGKPSRDRAFADVGGRSPDPVDVDCAEIAAFLHSLGLGAASGLTAADDLRPDCGRIAGHLLYVDLADYQRPRRWTLLPLKVMRWPYTASRSRRSASACSATR